MEQLTTTSSTHGTSLSLCPEAAEATVRGRLAAASTLRATDESLSQPRWRVEPQHVCARVSDTGSNPQLAMPAGWLPVLRQLSELTRVPVAPPRWWTPETSYSGGIETQTEPGSCTRNGENQPATKNRSGLYLHLGLAGWGHFQIHGEGPQRVTPGRVFFAFVPSQHRCYLPQESPGWTFAWVGIHHPYVRARLAKQVAASHLVIDAEPNDALTARVLRLVRGAIKKDFRDQFETEMALFDLALTFERWVQQSRKSASQGQRLMDDVRSRVIAGLPQNIGIDALAAEFGMSRSHFSHFFRERTGLTPAHFATEVRVQRAARMLLDTRVPLKIIADACGFANANHLCKVFRRFHHLSPATFRQVCR